MEEEDEEVKKKKRRLDCPPPSQHQQNVAPSEAQPATVEVAVEVQQSEEEKLKQEQEKEFIVNADHRFLVEKIQRLQQQINSPLTLKLRDKGEKIRRSLAICEQELQRRKQFSPTLTKEAGCENSKQSKNSSPDETMPSHSPNEKSALPVPIDKGASSNMRFVVPPTQAHSESKPTSWLYQILGKKKGLPFSGGNPKPKGLLFNKDRQAFNLPMRPPFRRRFSAQDKNLPHRLSRRGSSGANLAEVLGAIHAMQQQFENIRNQLASFESNVTTRIDRLETRVEQIIQVQSGDKSSNSST